MAPHWDTSGEWDVARRTGYTPATSIEVWLDGGYVTTIVATGGTVTCDEQGKPRRTLSLPTSSIELDPHDAEDVLAPFGTELRVFAGMEYSGSTELVPVGVFSLESSSRGGWHGDMTLVGIDRAGVLAEARFLAPWNTANGTPAVEEIAAMVLAAYPNVEVYDLTGSEARLRQATWDRERWDAIDNIAKGIGAEVFFDQVGRCIIRDVSTVANLELFGQDPIAVHANREDSDLLDVSTSMSRAGVYNAVVASSDQEIPVSAIAYQATGPLRYRPGFQRPRFFSTPVVTTYDGIAQAALSILARSIAYSRQVNVEMIPDAALDVGSLVDLTYPDGTTETRVLSSFSLPLGPGGMSIGTRVDAEAEVSDDAGTLE